jgi:hypothetical protein
MSIGSNSKGRLGTCGTLAGIISAILAILAFLGIEKIWDVLPDLNKPKVESSRSTAPKSVEIVIPGDSTGTNTGVFLSKGDKVELVATGLVDTWPDKLEGNNPQGAPDGNGNVCTEECLLPSAEFGALIGRIGNSESWFLVGSYQTLTADRTGQLTLAVNDTISDNNIGDFNVTVQQLP